MGKYRVLNLITVRWYNACAHYALCAARALKAQGIEVFFAGLPGSPVMKRSEEEGFERVDNVNLAVFQPFTLARSWQALNAFCRRKGVTHVFSHCGEDHLIASLLQIRSKGTLLHLNVRADIRRPKNHFLNRMLYRRGVWRLIVPSGFMKGYFSDMGVPQDSVTILPQPFDGKGFSDRPAHSMLRNRLRVSDNDILVGIIARLDPVKGHYHVMEAANRLAHQQRIKFLVSGETFDVSPNELKAKLLPEAAGNVFFMDRAEDVRELLHAIDIGLVASTGSEAMCRIALEMAGAGLPVIGTRIHSIPEIIVHEKGGLIVPPGNPGAISEAILRLSDDAILRAAMGQFNLERVRKEYSMEVFGQGLLRVLEGGA